MRRALLVWVWLLGPGCGDDDGRPADGPLPGDGGADAVPGADAVGTCAIDDDCEDSNPCTNNLCNAGTCEFPHYREGEPCNDGIVCTFPDVCTSGVCGGGPRDCSAWNDTCHTGACDPVMGCQAVPIADGTACDDGLFCTTGDTCQAGLCAGTDRDCGASADDCHGAACDEVTSTCARTALPDDTVCDDARFCTAVDRCQGGTCVGGAPPACADASACTADLCDPVADACLHPPRPPLAGAEGPVGNASCANGVDDDCDGRIDGGDPSCVTCSGPPQCDDGSACTSDGCGAGGVCANTPLTASFLVDPTSPVGTTSAAPDEACLVAGSAARLVAWTRLRDTAGSPLSGATVTIGGQAAAESTSRPGTYAVVVSAAGSPQSQSLPVVATTCAGATTLTAEIVLDHAPANATAGGTGGCSPAGGNLRVKVVTEAGAPLAGASVLVGLLEGTPFEHAPEAVFGGTPQPAANVAVTDAGGFAIFFDYGDALDGPITVTAGASGRAYATIADAQASDLVLALPPLHPPEPATTPYTMGTGTTEVQACNDIDAGLVLPALDLDFFSALSLPRFFGKSRCWDSGSANVGVVSLPENLWVPSQSFYFLCAGGELNEAPWSLELPAGTTADLQLVHVLMPVTTVQMVLDQGGGFTDLLPGTVYRRLGFLLDVAVPSTPVSGRSITANEWYDTTFVVTYGLHPPETDVIGFSLGDRAGENGTGPLFMIGHAVHPYDAPGSAVALPNADLDQPGNPGGARRLASLSAFYLDPKDHPDVPLNERSGVSTVLLRGDGATPPFGPAGGSAFVHEFFGLVGTISGAPRDFRWGNASRNGHLPRYSRHELTLRTERYLPVLPCSTENDVRAADSAQWIVYKPFGLGCGADECLSLPVLPASFPRAGTALGKRDGFEALAATGAACTGGCGGGGACVDPDGSAGSAEAMCMAGTGTSADPYLVDSYHWTVHVYDLGLAGAAWDFDAFDLATHAATVTMESMNTQALE